MLAKFSVKKPYTVIVGIILVIALGVISFMNMTTDLLPSMDLPYVMVYTTYTGATPTKTATVQYTYTFNNKWDKEIVAVAGDVTYTAQFDATVNTYTVVWKNSETANEQKTEPITYHSTLIAKLLSGKGAIMSIAISRSVP